MGRKSALEGPAFDYARDLLRDGVELAEVRERVWSRHGELFSLNRLGAMKGAVLRTAPPQTDPLLAAILREHPYIFKQEAA